MVTSVTAGTSGFAAVRAEASGGGGGKSPSRRFGAWLRPLLRPPGRALALLKPPGRGAAPVVLGLPGRGALPPGAPELPKAPRVGVGAVLGAGPPLRGALPPEGRCGPPWGAPAGRGAGRAGTPLLGLGCAAEGIALLGRVLGGVAGRLGAPPDGGAPLGGPPAEPPPRRSPAGPPVFAPEVSPRRSPDFAGAPGVFVVPPCGLAADAAPDFPAGAGGAAGLGPAPAGFGAAVGAGLDSPEAAALGLGASPAALGGRAGLLAVVGVAGRSAVVCLAGADS